MREDDAVWDKDAHHKNAREEGVPNGQQKRRRYGKRKGPKAWETVVQILATRQVPDGPDGKGDWRWATDTRIAEYVGVSRRTIQRWAKRPDIAARVAALDQELREQWEREWKQMAARRRKRAVGARAG